MALDDLEDELAEHVRRAQAGDEDAFSALYTAVQPRVLRYLRLLVGEDAEDVASEVWFQVTRDLRGFSGDGPGFRGWTATIARNRAMDHLRRTKRRPSTPVPVEKLVELASSEDMAGTMIATESAVQLISRLPKDQAEAVLLRVVLDLDVETVARVLGKRSGAIRTSAYRGLRGLAKILEKSDPNWVTGATAVALEDMK